MTDKQRKDLVDFLEDAEQRGFYGEIVFKYRNGEIYTIFKGQSLKLEDLSS